MALKGFEERFLNFVFITSEALRNSQEIKLDDIIHFPLNLNFTASAYELTGQGRLNSQLDTK